MPRVALNEAVAGCSRFAMGRSAPKRRRKSKFPLTLHPTGQWCKKIRGKLHYFGTDKQAAHESYLREAADLHAGHPIPPRLESNGLTIKDLANHYLAYCRQRANTGEVTLMHFDDCHDALLAFVNWVGKATETDALTPEQFLGYRATLVKRYAPTTVNRHVAIVKAMFNYGLDFDLIDRPPNLRKAFAKVPTKQVRRFKAAKKRENGEPIFAGPELRAILDKASGQLGAMVLLGINAGFGNMDCAQLRRQDVDLDKAMIDYDRQKTAVRRTAPLWPETVEALKRIRDAERPKARHKEHEDLIFLTRFGRPWVNIEMRTTKKGKERVVRNDEVSKQFNKLLNGLGIKRRGLGFYSLRHTHATLADRARDIHAQKRIMGHAIPGMLGDYIEDIELKRLRTVVNMVHDAVFAEKKPGIGGATEKNSENSRSDATSEAASPASDDAGELPESGPPPADSAAAPQ